MSAQSRQHVSMARPSEESVASTIIRSSLDADDILSESASARPKSLLGTTARWRRAVGLLLLMVTVFLWTASNFLASTIFADDSYSKPFFVTYINTATFIIPLIPTLAYEIYRRPGEAKNWPSEFWALLRKRSQNIAKQEDVRTGTPYHVDMSEPAESQELLLDDSQQLSGPVKDHMPPLLVMGKATVPETARLALEFCLLWFVANYFVAACLEYTTVASATILTSTSSVFTLAFGALFRVERFSMRKLLGVLASLAGIIMISSIDLSGRSNDDEHRGDFPEKNVSELAIGNALALLSALFYGIYAVVMKARLGDESRVNMPLFFGMVGLFNILLLWPGFFILHFTGVEKFEMPGSGFVWLIVVCNSLASLASDISWAFAVLLTSPIVVTVGLSMTIPLSLIGEMLLNNQTATVLYWIGACIVVLSFLFINHEEKIDEEDEPLVRNIIATSGTAASGR